MDPVDGEKLLSVVAVDDHPFILESIRANLHRHGRFELVAVAVDGVEGLRVLRQLRPALAVVDINLPGLDGLEVVRRVRAVEQPTRIVVLSGGDPERDAPLARWAGASAYVSKSHPFHLLAAALDMVHQGYIAFPDTVGNTSLDDEAGRRKAKQLTPRESRVFQLLSEGYDNLEIATRLGISPKTVATFKHRVSKKLEQLDDVGRLPPPG
ncbi:response regulator transcription factor [Cupriavidus sp. CV2]|uniref:response regulator transcription factor n=1 Tax=Cupriavidus ulmosensis TaxID=3065913 RepID=UPI00296B14B3|nr:response regulator transcription factor [Cupriavidus sp. CV2]MDW3686031.1 response regulator transcription factor [Cupriavidus sp. CV2]